MYWTAPLFATFGYFLFELVTNKRWWRVAVVFGIGAIITGIVVYVDYLRQTTDTEIWSGYIEGWNHEEEWDEWIPPHTTCSTDSKGHRTCTTTPGHYVHHYAENYIKTTDDGWISVSVTPDGRQMNDSFPNHTEELKEMFPYKTATASRHTYTNKVQASYSIYRHKDIDLKEFPNLPEYPDQVKGYFYVDRIVGNVPHKAAALKLLNEKNSELNKMVPDPEHPGKKRSWKEVNLIFVNVGDKPQDYGFALQDKWEGGNKNDFVVAFSTKKDGTLKWVYPFSWSESELLKIQVREYMMGLKKLDDFTTVVNHVSDMVADKFTRKQFADFNYLQIETSTGANSIIWVLNIFLEVIAGFISWNNPPDNGRGKYY